MVIIDGNKDAAEQCIIKGLACLDEGDCDNALRLFEKSDRLYASDRAKGLLKVAQDRKVNPPKDDNKKSNKNENINLRPRHGAAKTTESTEDVKPVKKFTPEQAAAVKHIKAAKTHYEVLNVTQSATEKEIKKAYRMLALKNHPDKNPAPGAEDAFKKVSKAFQVLSDPATRKRYDMYGDDKPVNGMSYSRGGGAGMQQMSAEELFNMFFNGMHPNEHSRSGGFPGYRTQTFSFGHGGGGRRRAEDHSQQSQQQHVDTSGIAAILQILIPFIILYMFLFSNAYTASPYTMQPGNPSYPIAKETSQKGIPYYVGHSYDRDHRTPADRYKLEYDVEKQYEKFLIAQCKEEQSNQRHELLQARYQGDQDKIIKLQHKTPVFCKKLREFRVTS